ncbi:hypothetical protein BCV70DRAFT_97334 [Testicularia cyperi]|uniref:Uncharacterized protein n=1 Tax=Testicularia cyperi TaxID=1882483 RepID=A0A317XQB5_9BASI|nr:hypothetical protein BCV70DRAFT_97334 [Testicularia cyperi]
MFAASCRELGENPENPDLFQKGQTYINILLALRSRVAGYITRLRAYLRVFMHTIQGPSFRNPGCASEPQLQLVLYQQQQSTQSISSKSSSRSTICLFHSSRRVSILREASDLVSVHARHQVVHLCLSRSFAPRLPEPPTKFAQQKRYALKRHLVVKATYKYIEN